MSIVQCTLMHDMYNILFNIEIFTIYNWYYLTLYTRTKTVFNILVNKNNT